MRHLLLLATLAVALLTALPAQAHLGHAILEFEQSPLLMGDTLFRYEGRIGSRYRFGPAPRCRFGNGLLYLDTIDGTIVQEMLVLPLPDRPKERRTVDGVVETFLHGSGLSPDNITAVKADFKLAVEEGKSCQKELKGLDPGAIFNENVYVNVALHSVMIVVGLKP